jgi:hypothetical protein
MSALAVHPEHRQGDVLLADGARLFTCTKTLHNEARAPMLLVPHLFRLDVCSHDDSFEVKLRNLTGGRIESTLGRHVERAGVAFDGSPLKITEFTVTAVDAGIGPIVVSVCLPAIARGYEFPCTAMAIIPDPNG